MADKLTIAVNFDGAIHSYEKEWRGAGEVPGMYVTHVVPGFFDWLEQAVRVFSVVIYSTRAKTSQGITEMRRWLTSRYKEWAQEQGRLDSFSVLDVTFSIDKPAAWLTIDDHAIRFVGDWDDPALTVDAMRNFKSWKETVVSVEPGTEESIMPVAQSMPVRTSAQSTNNDIPTILWEMMITEVKLTVGIPVVGIVPSILVSGVKDFTVESVNWTPPDTVFNNGVAYVIQIALQANNGFVFDKDGDFTVNGEEAYIVDNAGDFLVLEYEFPVILG